MIAPDLSTLDRRMSSIRHRSQRMKAATSIRLINELNVLHKWNLRLEVVMSPDDSWGTARVNTYSLTTPAVNAALKEKSNGSIAKMNVLCNPFPAVCVKIANQTNFAILPVTKFLLLLPHIVIPPPRYSLHTEGETWRTWELRPFRIIGVDSRPPLQLAVCCGLFYIAPTQAGAYFTKILPILLVSVSSGWWIILS